MIDHDVMKDAIDADAARRVLARLGGETVAVLAKAEAAPSGEIRGRRHTMLDDSDIHSTRHARALVGGVLAGVIGDTHALRLRRRRAPGPGRRRAGGDHWEGLIGPRASRPARAPFADIDLRPMVAEVAALGWGKSLCAPFYRCFREAKPGQCQFAESEAPKIFVVEPRRNPNFSVIVECNESSVEQQIGIRGEQEPIHAVEALACCLT